CDYSTALSTFLYPHTATTDIYSLSLHDALPILPYVEEIAEHGLAEAVQRDPALARGVNVLDGKLTYEAVAEAHSLDYVPLEDVRSEEHTSELQSQSNLVCRLLLEKKKKKIHIAR